MIRCIAIDDEPLALKQLAGYIRKTPFLRLRGEFHSAVDAMKIVADKGVDLIFVDINMPDLNGLEFVKSLTVKPMIIFSTAYSEYALEGFKVDAIDYLLKPISYADFFKAAEKAYLHFNMRKEHIQKEASPSGQLFVKSDYKLVSIDIPSITHIESQSEYVRIFSETQRPVMTLSSMKSIEDRLGNSFMRIHRSYIINLKKIAFIDRSNVILTGDIRLPVGEQYKEALRNYTNRSG